MRRQFTVIAAIGIALVCSVAFAKPGSHAVRAHTTKKGVYVQPHHATNPDGSKLNNWSTEGNVNPYTGKPGTKRPAPPKR